VNSLQDANRIMIEFRNVRYSPDGQRDVLSSLNLEIEAGETLVLLGRSGCGKSTTLKMINRLIEPSDGEVIVEGRPVKEWDPILLRRRIGYVIQEVGLLPHFNIERNISLLPQIEGWPPEQRSRRVEELLEIVALDPGNFRHRYPCELSGGQRQRVGVARALATNPPILLMDEPFGALDPLTRAEIQHEFLALQERLHKTIVFVTHDIREALIVGTRIALLEAGELVGTYSRTDFLNSNDSKIAAYREVLRTGNDATEQ
jgi:osmoprotectant transport system ATP-binding protein